MIYLSGRLKAEKIGNRLDVADVGEYIAWFDLLSLGARFYGGKDGCQFADLREKTYARVESEEELRVYERTV